MRVIFDRWWLPPIVFAFALGGVYSYERWGPHSINAAVEFPFGRVLIILLACLYLLISVVYQTVKRRWIPALISVAVLMWAVAYFLI